MERVFRREIVRRLFFVFMGVRGNAVQDIPVFCGWMMWPASLLPLRSKFCICPRHMSTQVSLRPVPVAGLCGPVMTCFPVGLPSGAGGHVYLSWLSPPYGHVCDNRLRFDPLDRRDSGHIHGKTLKLSALQDLSHDMNLPRPPFGTTSWQETDHLIN